MPPWKFEENLAELVACAPRYGLDEVIVKVDSEEFHHGHGILEWLRAYQPCLHKTREALNAIGVDYSLNPWISIGHNDRGRNSIEQLPGLQTVVAHDGKAMKNRACPLSPVWRENVRKLWTLYAETNPKVIWIEDDIKFHLGGGCFCPLHLAEFSKRIGRPVEREEIVEAVNAPGQPHPWRKPYLSMLADTVIDAVGFLRETVQVVSPETYIGLMSSGPRSHCRSGHRWKELAAAARGEKYTFYSRPPLGSYSEGDLRALYHTQDSIKITRYCVGADAIDQTEVENWPFSRYSKSATFTFLQMAISFVYGAKGVTMNLFDHMGRAMESTPEIGRMLGERKPFLNSLATKAQSPGAYRGVQIVHRDAYSAYSHAESGTKFSFLEDGFRMAEMLEACGIPTTFDEEQVIALQGQIVRSLSDDEIRATLAKGVFLDGVAAKILVERGFGQEIGLQSVGTPTLISELGIVSAEENHHPGFAGAPRTYMTMILPALSSNGRFCLLSPLPGAQEISRIVDPDEKTVCVGSIAFENALGGRVFTMGHELASCQQGTPGMLSPERKNMLRAVLKYLGRGEPPVEIDMDGAYPLLFRKDCGDRTLVGAFNFSLDDWPEAVLSIHDGRKLRSLQYLGHDGQWRDCSPAVVAEKTNVTEIRHGSPVRYTAPILYSLQWEG
jgi:hypothetical protein